MNALRAWIPGISARPQCVVDSIGGTRAKLHDVSNTTLSHLTEELRSRLVSQPALRSNCISQGIALAAEAARRELGIEPFSTQLLAAVVMARGQVAEMQTGEGKTLAVALAAAALALHGRGVHVASSNAYLAARDAQQASQMLQRIGITVGLIESQAPAGQKRHAYACDITYGAGSEFGFDYLRDQLQRLNARPRRIGDSVAADLRHQLNADGLQSTLSYALIDELDCVLIDEAGLPLILSETCPVPHDREQWLNLAASAARHLRQGEDFICDNTRWTVSFTEQGLSRLAAPTAVLGGELNLPCPWIDIVRQSLHAIYMLKRNVHYVVSQQKIHLVDRITGRIHPDRRWQDGLHQAVEHKEGVPISEASVTTARITRQKFYRQYAHISGATGTACDAAAELQSTYALSVVAIPLRLPSRRTEQPDRYFATDTARNLAVVQEVKRQLAAGRPVLIGCPTIDRSMGISRELQAATIPHALLNGIQDADEAAIIRRAGLVGAVTVATNLAGRGTDIELEASARNAGGLHVIAVEHHHCTRVDRQLLGRAGRQGDPGSGQFFVASEDAVLQSAPETANEIRRFADPLGESHGDWSRKIRQLQIDAERTARCQRHELMAHDHWLDELLIRLA